MTRRAITTMRRRQRRIFFLSLPALLDVLANPEVMKQLAEAGLKVNQVEVDALRQVHFEEQVRSMGIPLTIFYPRKIGATMQTNGEVLDAKQFLAVIKKAFEDSKKPSITQWAESLGVSYQFLSHVMRGDYNPGPALAKALGYQQIYGFRRKTVFTSADIRRGVAALKGKNVQPANKDVAAIIKGDLAASKKAIAGQRKTHRAAARIYKGKHGSKKTQAKKK